MAIRQARDGGSWRPPSQPLSVQYLHLDDEPIVYTRAATRPGAEICIKRVRRRNPKSRAWCAAVAEAFEEQAE
ncbi:hypothetical protein AB5J55_43465 [Streptomyces sp. R11]|uniref:Uncharacterized protein n=1 Tax=Streptomyces sp. R11 TaxID=3238625 RepID=A0AB39NDG1_9ACTN